MNTKVVTAALLGTIVGLIGGFILANSINRSEINNLKARPEQQGTAPGGQKQNDAFNIDPDEIKAKIAEADGNAGNFSFQKNLGLALYRYAAMKQDATLMADATRILERANSLDPKDYDVIVALGNSYFDTGYFAKDKASFQKARVVYGKALASKPDDADVITDVALTYFLDDPPELEKAVVEFNKALKFNPKHERALQFLTQTLLRQNNYDEAARTLDKLRAANPKNETIAGLESQIAAREYAPVK